MLTVMAKLWGLVVLLTVMEGESSKDGGGEDSDGGNGRGLETVMEMVVVVMATVMMAVGPVMVMVEAWELVEVVGCRAGEITLGSIGLVCTTP